MVHKLWTCFSCQSGFLDQNVRTLHIFTIGQLFLICPQSKPHLSDNYRPTVLCAAAEFISLVYFRSIHSHIAYSSSKLKRWNKELISFSSSSSGLSFLFWINSDSRLCYYGSQYKTVVVKKNYVFDYGLNISVYCIL